MKKIEKKDIVDIMALTPMQKGLLFLHLKNSKTDHYFEQLILDVTGTINLGLFERAWNFVAASNEMLRTFFRWENLENPVQMTLRQYKLKIKYYDFSLRHPHERKKSIDEIKVKERKLDLNFVPFMITLYRSENHRYGIIITHHHILYDGWSTGIILKEFFSAYNEMFQGRTPIKPIKTKYKQFIRWIQKQDENKQEHFWRKYLEGFHSMTELPIKRKTKEVGQVSRHLFEIPADMKNRMEEFVNKHKITLAILFYSGWGILLQKYSYSNDVVFGTTISGRNTGIKGVEDIVGLFINTIPMRVRVHPCEKSIDFLHRMSRALLTRKEFESTSLVDIMKYSQVDKKKELFDTVVVLKNYPLDIRRIQGQEGNPLMVTSYSTFEESSFDLIIGMNILKDIRISMDYNRGSFDNEVISSFSRHYVQIVEDFISHPGKELYENVRISSGGQDDDMEDIQVEFAV